MKVTQQARGSNEQNEEIEKTCLAWWVGANELPVQRDEHTLHHLTQS